MSDPKGPSGDHIPPQRRDELPVACPKCDGLAAYTDGKTIRPADARGGVRPVEAAPSGATAHVEMMVICGCCGYKWPWKANA